MGGSSPTEMCFSLIAGVRHLGCDAADKGSLTKAMARKLTHRLEPVPRGEQMLIEMMGRSWLISGRSEPVLELASMSLDVGLAGDIADWLMVIVTNQKLSRRITGK